MARGFKTGGRRAGTPNRITADVRGAIVAAFEGVGGVEYLKAQATSNPQAFMTLLGKVLPLQVSGDPDNPVKIEFGWAKSSG